MNRQKEDGSTSAKDDSPGVPKERPSAKDDSPQEIRIVSKDLFDKICDKYGDSNVYIETVEKKIFYMVKVVDNIIYKMRFLMKEDDLKKILK